MICKCAWCGIQVGLKPPFDSDAVSHTICLTCEQLAMSAIFDFGEPADRMASSVVTKARADMLGEN